MPLCAFPSPHPLSAEHSEKQLEFSAQTLKHPSFVSQTVNTDLKINKLLNVSFSNTVGFGALKKPPYPEPNKQETQWFGQDPGMSFLVHWVSCSLGDSCTAPWAMPVSQSMSEHVSMGIHMKMHQSGKIMPLPVISNMEHLSQ